MSMLEELNIQGIRSFGPEHPQRIKFSTPVTLILGPNGTGKTTIIECLKYAVTGELPPGPKTGASFIHDPKLTRSIEVKAKVALKVRDVQNCPLVVARSLVATQRGTAKQPSLKTLDGTIKRISPTGELISVSSRCGDIDKEMAVCLGASKAVFDNVIFCHQEESNWPLQEPKAVKERFDDLFTSNCYVKALDAIRKSRLTQEEGARTYRTELKYLSRSKEEANSVRHQKIDVERDLRNQSNILSKFDEKIGLIDTKLTLYRGKYKELVEYKDDARSCVAEKTHLEALLQELTEQIDTEFDGTDEELKDAFEKTEEQFAEKQLVCEKAEKDLQCYRTMIESNEETKSNLIVRRTRLEIEAKRLEEALKRRNEVLRKFADDLKMHEISEKISNLGDVCDTDVEIVRKHLEVTLQKAELQRDLAKAALESDGRRAQTAIDESRSSLVRVEQLIASQESALVENERMMAKVEDKLLRANSASVELDTLRNKLAEATKARAELTSSSNEADLRRSLEKAQEERSACESAITTLDNQIGEAQRRTITNHQISMLEENKRTAIEMAKKLRSRNLDLLEQIFSGEPIPPVSVSGSQTPNNLAKEFNKRIVGITASSKASLQNLGALRQELSKVEAQLSFQRKRLHEKEDARRAIEERFISAFGSVDLESNLDKLITKKKQIESDYMDEEGSLHLWRKFRTRLINESECPLCHRGFENKQDHEDLQKEIDKRIVTMPRELNARKVELQQIVTQYEKLIELKPDSSKLATLDKTELPELKAQIQHTQSVLERLQSEIEQETAKLEVLQADESVARSLQGDIAVIEAKEEEVTRLNCSLRSLIPAGEDPASKSVLELQEEREILCAKRKLLSTNIENLNDKVNEESEKIRKAVEDENKYRNALFQLEQECQEITGLHAESQRLTAVRTRINHEVEELRKRLPTCESALARAEGEKAKISREGEEKMALLFAECQEWRDRSRRMTEVCESVLFKSEDGLSPMQHLKRVTEQLANLDATIEELKTVLSTTSKRVEALHTEIANHKLTQRKLRDCMRLRETRAQLSRLNDRVQEIQQKIDACQCTAESTNLAEDIGSLTSKGEGLRQQRQEVNDKITKLKTELRLLESSLTKHADSEKEYMKKTYELKTVELAATDLHRYYQALDRAIMVYHTQKMEEVNQIIRELWRTTYRGNDIDHIKICSEEEPLTANTNVARTRRIYNYRVVMVKAGSNVGEMSRGKHARLAATETPLDMRGRCSAGQKVLASLVIRLALAEVFCLQCGVLALDEPTTNLDRENIESLAYALTEIIKTRSSQRNFQLIVITHDEDFIELLGRAGCAGHLQRLVRNLEGLSEVQKIRLED